MKTLPLLNFRLKQKLSFEEWDKIELTLGCKINIIKLITAPQFNYVLMMVPIIIPSDIFKRYEHLIKHFLWGGKGARIKLEKFYAPKEKVSLGLLDPKLYCLSFEMAKLPSLNIRKVRTGRND